MLAFSGMFATCVMSKLFGGICFPHLESLWRSPCGTPSWSYASRGCAVSVSCDRTLGKTFFSSIVKRDRNYKLCLPHRHCQRLLFTAIMSFRNVCAVAPCVCAHSTVYRSRMCSPAHQLLFLLTDTIRCDCCRETAAVKVSCMYYSLCWNWTLFGVPSM